MISDVIDVAPQEIRDDVEKFSELCGLRSFKSEEAFKKYKHAKKIRKAMYEEYGYSEEEMDDYFEEYDRYFGDMTEEEEFAEAPAETEVKDDSSGEGERKEESGKEGGS